MDDLFFVHFPLQPPSVAYTLTKMFNALNDLTTDAYNASDARFDNNAKIWDGDETKQAAWLSVLDDDIETSPYLRNIVFRGTVDLRNGKTAVDSKFAILAITDGSAKKLRTQGWGSGG